MPSLRALVVGTVLVGVFAAVPVAAHTRGGGSHDGDTRPSTEEPSASRVVAAEPQPAVQRRADPAKTKRPLFLQLNTCGRDCDGSAEARAKKLSAAIARRKPVAVSLNEVCAGQLRALRSDLADRGYRMYSRFVKTWTVSFGSCLDEAYGNVVLTRAKPLDTDRLTYGAQTSSSDKRAIVCVKVRLKEVTRVCSTHLVPGGDAYDVRNQQASEARDQMESYTAPVVTMGDFNSPPSSDIVDRLYAADTFDGGAYGDFLEADAADGGSVCRCGEATMGSSKLDFIYVEEADFALKSADAATDAFSDHKRLWGKPRWR